MSLITVVRDARKTAYSTDASTLAELRTELEHDKIMLPGDRFSRNGSEILKEQEPKIVVKDALSKNTLTIVSAEKAGGAGGASPIKIIRGAATRSYPFDLKRPLSELRQKLAGDKFMESDDRFEIDGAEVPANQESRIAVSEALRKGAITITSAELKEAAGSGAITVTKGSAKRTYSINKTSALADLRKKLEADRFMTSADRFEIDGAEVPVKQEERITVEEALTEDGITIKADSIVRPGEVPETPDLSDTLPEASDWSLEPISQTDPRGILDDLNADFGSARTEGLEYYYQLKDKQKKTLLFKKLQLTRGMSVDGTGFSRAPREVVKLASEPVYSMPDVVLDSDRQMSFSEIVHELRKRGVRNAGGSIGVPGFALSAEYRKEEESATLTKETTIYLLATLNVPKVELFLFADQIAPTDEFTRAIEGVLRMPGRYTVEHYMALLRTLNEFGYYVPTQFTLGGQIWDEDRQQVKEKTEAVKKMESFGAAFQANLSLAGVPVSAGASYGQGSQEQMTDEEKTAVRRIRKRLRGGDPAAVGSPADWVASLGSCVSWAVIKYPELRPTISLLPSDRRADCARIIDKHYLHASTRKVTAVDMESYARALTSGDSDDF